MIQVNSLLIKILEKMILNRINKTEKELLNKRQKGFVKLGNKHESKFK